MPNPWTETGAPINPCADIPDAPQPARWQPPPGARVRNGRKVPLHLYLHAAGDEVGQPIGVVYHSPELARFVAEAADLRLQLAEASKRVDLGAPPYPELVAIYRDAEALLAGRNAGHPGMINQELRRMRTELDRAIRVVEDMAEGGDGG